MSNAAGKSRVTTDYADDTGDEMEYGVWQMSFNVIGIGEVLWDLLPSGAQLGGAPANFAWHAHQLGAKAQIISRVGKDRLGEEIRQRLAKMELPGALVQTDAVNPTSTVTVV